MFELLKCPPQKEGFEITPPQEITQIVKIFEHAESAQFKRQMHNGHSR